ncbi:DEAD/DEAH box RNA helicase [Thraustotheca clavata]|uniref:DEAD/DEAH box RNA helicase n=1 Tax=Thraustotheca clavata TaxID=74557 RepID=A0A1V9ZSF4_9STRA|nr:DEAD/DEAH box RNA helicase [Thraustotheca clavata]
MWLNRSLLLRRSTLSVRHASSFLSLGLCSELCDALQAKGITTPTDIQAKTITAALKGANVICTDTTGSGKTLAYLLPVVERLRQAEKALLAKQTNSEIPLKREVSRPKVLVLVPSRELGIQVGAVARDLAHFSKFSSTVITGGSAHKPQKMALNRPLDILVATPGRLATFLKNGHVFVSRVEYVIIDEADTLLDRKMGFRSIMDEVLKPVEASAAAKNRKVQYLLAAATVKPPMDEVFSKSFKDLKWVSGNTVHQTPRSITEEFIRVPGSDGKHAALRESLSLWNKGKSIVFCNSTASCRSTEHMLHEHGYRSTSLHGDIPPVVRKKNFGAFTSSEASILVCTDLAARGLDMEAVDHVINFDFPKSSVDYLHRAGRTGRAGKRGVVTSLITKHDAATARLLADAKGRHQPIADMSKDGTLKLSKFNPFKEKTDDASKPNKLALHPRHKGTRKIKPHKLRTVRK